MQSFVENPHSSIRKVAQAIEVSTFSKIIMKEKWHPFKIIFTQELAECDFDRRNEFCDEMMCRCDNDNTFLDNIIFSDKVSFEF